MTLFLFEFSKSCSVSCGGIAGWNCSARMQSMAGERTMSVHAVLTGR